MKLPNIAVSFLKSPTPICYWIRNTEVNRYCCIFRKINNIFFRSSFWGIFFLQYKHVSVMFRHSSWPISIKKSVDPACSSNNIWVKTDSNNKWWPNGDQKNTHDFLSVHLYIFFFCTVYQGLGFYYFYYFFSNRVICRPSDHTEGRPRAGNRTRDGWSRGRDTNH